MKEAIAIINQKGGVGKSTTALALGAGLMKKGYRVLYIDLDAQGNLSYVVGAGGEHSVLDALRGDIPTQEAIDRTPAGDILAYHPTLAAADMLFVETGKEYRLREAIAPIADAYDYIVVDTPPALGILTINALTACTSCIIPAQADIFSLQGINQLYQTMEAVKKYTNPKLNVLGILLTRYSMRAILNRDLAELIRQMAKQFGTTVFKTKIRDCIALREAQAKVMDIYAYAPKSNAAIDYRAFVEEVIRRS